VTLREVARRLEVSPTAIYRHFPDREALPGDKAVRSLVLAGLAARPARR
jgi:AcrR family transcriptional regulator